MVRWLKKSSNETCLTWSHMHLILKWLKIRTFGIKLVLKIPFQTRMCAESNGPSYERENRCYFISTVRMGFWHFMYVLVFKRLAFSWDWNSCNTLNFWTDSDWSMEYHFDLYKCVNVWIYDLLAFRDRWMSGLWTWGLPALNVWIYIMNLKVERLWTSNDSQ